MKSLNELKLGDAAVVKSVLAATDLSRRFSDIGLIENTRVKCVAVSPQGDPKAFLIRGAVIALRNCDSAQIEVV